MSLYIKKGTEEEGKAVYSGCGHRHCLSDWRVARGRNGGDKCRPWRTSQITEHKREKKG